MNPCHVVQSQISDCLLPYFASLCNHWGIRHLHFPVLSYNMPSGLAKQPVELRQGDFDGFLRQWAVLLLDMIEKATGKTISRRDSDETVMAFGAALSFTWGILMRFLAPCLVIVLLFSLSPMQAEGASDATATVREAISDLLDGFDDFKDSDVFRQCIYGCGSKNPGSEWRNRLTTLQRQAMRRKDVPTYLKDAIGELWQMGRSYARGNIRKAAELRQRVEAVLED